MHKDICDPTNEQSVENFRKVLIELDAKLVEKTDSTFSTIGQTLYTFKIDNKFLDVFVDDLSLDIAGPRDLVTKVYTTYVNMTK